MIWGFLALSALIMYPHPPSLLPSEFKIRHNHLHPDNNPHPWHLSCSPHHYWGILPTLPIQAELPSTGSTSSILAVSICPGWSISIAILLSRPVLDWPRQSSLHFHDPPMHHRRWSSSSRLHDPSWWLPWHHECNPGNTARGIQWCLTPTSLYSTIAGLVTMSWLNTAPMAYWLASVSKMKSFPCLT